MTEAPPPYAGTPYVEPRTGQQPPLANIVDMLSGCVNEMAIRLYDAESRISYLEAKLELQQRDTGSAKQEEKEWRRW